MATNNLLNNPSPTYRSFVDNQVLTDDQLNSVVDHFNYQDQLSRVLLSGVGIVCGMNLSQTDKKYIKLTQGAGITTAGDLLKMQETTYRGFKVFKDTNVKYGPFIRGENETITFWELERDTEPSDVNDISDFKEFADIGLEETVAVLYLEDYQEEDEDCSPVDCNTQGKQERRILRVLLVGEEEARHLAGGDAIYSQFLHHGERLSSPEWTPIYAPRVVLNPTNTDSFSEFRDSYSRSFKKLFARINTFSRLGVFRDLYEERQLDTEAFISEYEDSDILFQYIHDFYCDLCEACNELQQKLKEYYQICCPEPTAFPKHLLLGSPVGRRGAVRHRFYPSPAHHQPGMVQSLQACYRRIIEMLDAFSVEQKDEIRITPSRNDKVKLGQRAVPYYYHLSDKDHAAGFLKHWHEDPAEIVLNYYENQYPEGFDPLNIDLKQHDFYRIEGHAGWHVEDAHEEIQKLRDKHGLCFDVVPVAVEGPADGEAVDYEKHRVFFEDLQVVLQAWNEEHQCLMQSASKFFAEFSLDEPGVHTDYKKKPAAEAEVIPEREARETDKPYMEYAVYEEMFLQPLHLTAMMPQAKKKKPKENPVYKSIDTVKGTTGAKIFKGVKSSHTKGEFIYHGNLEIKDLVQQWDPAIKEATVDIPIELIGHLKETEDYRLTEIEDFTEENLKKYIEALEAQCRQTQSSKKRFQKLSSLRSGEEEHPWIEHYEYMLNRILASCCIIKKVKVLYDKILERKQQLLRDRVLDRFLELHPGAEHKAGVREGGTFVLVYYSAKKYSENERMHELLPDLGDTAGPVYPDQPFRRIDPGYGIRERLYRYWQPVESGLTNGTVVGDLSLPYICCSQTPSTTFVFPEQLATLRIPVDHICVEEESGADTVPLTVSPADAEVKAFIQNRDLAGVIVKNQNGTYFSANELNDADYGKTIRFEVNGQVVDPVLKVFEKPRPGFSYDENITYRNENTTAVVTFTNTSEPFDDLDFEWNFGGDTVPKKEAIKFTHQFNVEPGDNYDIEVSLTASNGSCSASFTQTVPLDVPELEEPDVPDPDANCKAEAESTIKKAHDLLGKAAQADSLQESAIFSVYKQQVAPLYQEVLDDLDQVLAGKRDTPLFAAILEVHRGIAGMDLFGDDAVDREKLEKQQQCAIIIYYELILLYFYVQLCRTSRVGGQPLTMNDRSEWPTFTKNISDEFPQVLADVQKIDPLLMKFTRIRKDLQPRLTDRMMMVVSELIRMMKKVTDA